MAKLPFLVHGLTLNLKNCSIKTSSNVPSTYALEKFKPIPFRSSVEPEMYLVMLKLERAKLLPTCCRLLTTV
jgi:hypothetical protein